MKNTKWLRVGGAKGYKEAIGKICSNSRDSPVVS